MSTLLNEKVANVKACRKSTINWFFSFLLLFGWEWEREKRKKWFKPNINENFLLSKWNWIMFILLYWFRFVVDGDDCSSMLIWEKCRSTVKLLFNIIGIQHSSWVMMIIITHLLSSAREIYFFRRKKTGYTSFDMSIVISLIDCHMFFYFARLYIRALHAYRVY